MKRVTIIGLLAAALTTASFGAASGQSDRAVERSGKTFHVRVCPGSQAGPNAAHCHAHVVTDQAGNVITAASPFALPSGHGPAQLRAAYNLTAAGSSSSIIAVVDAFGYSNAENDLKTYRSTYGLPSCTTSNGCFTKINQRGQKGSYPRENTGWAQETALDLDMVSAICPNCSIVLVQADSNSFADLAAAEDRAASIPGVVAISNSYGGGESGSSTYAVHYNHPGIAITVSSGDAGYGVEFPASSPDVVAVGGTSLKSANNARGYTETVWSGSGSGCSSVYAKPSWQQDAAGCTRRTVADVAAVADPNTGVAVYGPTIGKKSGWMVFGGTSASAPIIAGVFGINGGPTNSAQSIYLLNSNLFDITSGSNGSCGGSYLCTGAAGYDGPTGNGAPNGTVAF